MNSLMLADFEKMLEKSKRDHVLWTALSVVIITMIVFTWPVAQGPPNTPTEVVWLFVRSLLPAVLCLGILLVLVALHLRMESLLQRRLNEHATAEIIGLTSDLRSGEARRLAADLLWLRAAFADDQLARAFLAGQDWQGHPPTQPNPHESLAARRPRNRLRHLAVVLLASGLCMVSTLLLKTFEYAATHGSTVKLSGAAILGFQAGALLSIFGTAAYLLFEAHPDQRESKKPTPELVESWLSGNERARKALRHRARTHPELREIAERCGWRVNRHG